MSRIEKDFLGEKQLPDTAYYGVQTLRGKENFHITGIPMSTEPYFVKAFGYAKKAAALANRDLGVLDPKVANAIAAACDRLIAGELRDQFVTDFIQGGAGTSTNMNANEVIANVALESLGHKKGEYQYVNPNDHVNFGQSTNDMYPTAFRLALILRLGSYMEALTKLQEAFFAKGKEFSKVLKMGRTHLQDAVPMSLGPGVPRLGHDDRRRGPAHRRGPSVPARDQPRRDRDRHHGHGAPRLSGTGDQVPVGTHRLQVHPGRRPDRGHLGHRRLRAAVGRAEAHVVEADEDLQRHPPAGLRPALRLQRDQPAADAARLVDHAGQGQSGDPGSRQPDRISRHRPRPDGDAGGVGRTVAAQRDGAGDHVRALHLDLDDGERRQQPARELHPGHHRERGAHAAKWC